MPSASTSILRMPSASRSSLSHSTQVRSAIAAFSIGTTSSSRPRVMTKPPTCWERWRGKPISSRASASTLASCGSAGSRPVRRASFSVTPCIRPAPQHAGERADGVVGEPEHLADFPDGAAGAVADHGGGKAGAVAAVARHRCTGSRPRAARARNRRRCRAARAAPPRRSARTGDRRGRDRPR